MAKRAYFTAQYSLEEPATKQFSSGKYYMFLYIAKGTCHFKANDKWHFCSTENMILIKPKEKTSLRYRGGRYPLEILELRILPEYLSELSDENTDLLAAFQFVPYKTAIIQAKSNLSMLIKNITRNLIDLPQAEIEYGHILYEKNLLSLLLILFVRACIDNDKVHKSHKRKNILMDDIFRYIHEHLTDDLTLEQLEKEFFVSRYHICREFKRLSGQTPHAYIVKARLDLCRKYIEQGKSIREVYELGGFGGYNHFFRAFKKEYHMTPGEYYKSLKIE